MKHSECRRVVFEVVREVDSGHAAGAEFFLNGVAVGEGGFEAVEKVGHRCFGPAGDALEYGFGLGTARSSGRGLAD